MRGTIAWLQHRRERVWHAVRRVVWRLAWRLAVPGALMNVPADSLSAQTVQEQCDVTAGEINRNTPTQIDRVTVLINAVCFSQYGRVTLRYANLLLAPEVAISQESMDRMKPLLLNIWCTDPDLRQTIQRVDIQYVYYSDAGIYLGKLDLRRSECTGRDRPLPDMP
jgi:hypothetical protein